MTPEEALQALRRADAGSSAPERVEAAVLDAFRSRPKRQFRYAWAAAAAIALVAAGLWLAHSTRRPAPTQTQVAPAPTRELLSPPPPIPVRAVAQHRPRPARRMHRLVESSALVSQFIPVPYAPPLPSDEIRIVRVRVEPEALGPWAEANDIREADVVAGADGIVRAVRWVR
jgi:hypothetical protein